MTTAKEKNSSENMFVDTTCSKIRVSTKNGGGQEELNNNRRGVRDLQAEETRGADKRGREGRDGRSVGV